MKRVRATYLPPIKLDRTGGSLHRQLYGWFRSAIVTGELHAGRRLPSTRGLAAALNISRTPVLTAFEQLLAEGYLESSVGSGTYVATSIPQGRQRAGAPAVQAVPAAPAQPFRPWPTGPFRASLPCIDQFPKSIWFSLLARHARRLSDEAYDYGDPMGYAPFREAVAAYLGAARGVHCNPSQIMVVQGSMHGLRIAARVLLEAGDAVWLEEPGYPGARRALTAARAAVVPVPVDSAGLVVAEGVRRANAARAAYVTPAHQYPLGVTMDATRRLDLLSWAARAGAWIIEDDYDSEFRYDARPIASLQGLDRDGRVIYLGTLSKILFPALRIAYLVLPEALVAAFCTAREADDIFSPVLYQAALADFIDEGHFARHIRRMRTLYSLRRATLLSAIHGHLGDMLEVVGSDAGLHVTGLFPPGVDDAALCRQAAAAGIASFPLSSCCMELPKRGGIILGYGSAEADQIDEAVQRLAGIVARLV